MIINTNLLISPKQWKAPDCASALCTYIKLHDKLSLFSSADGTVTVSSDSACTVSAWLLWSCTSAPTEGSFSCWQWHYDNTCRLSPSLAGVNADVLLLLLLINGNDLDFTAQCQSWDRQTDRERERERERQTETETERQRDQRFNWNMS